MFKAAAISQNVSPALTVHVHPAKAQRVPHVQSACHCVGVDDIHLMFVWHLHRRCLHSRSVTRLVPPLPTNLNSAELRGHCYLAAHNLSAFPTAMWLLMACMHTHIITTAGPQVGLDSLSEKTAPLFSANRECCCHREVIGWRLHVWHNVKQPYRAALHRGRVQLYPFMRVV